MPWGMEYGVGHEEEQGWPLVYKQRSALEKNYSGGNSIVSCPFDSTAFAPVK